MEDNKNVRMIFMLKSAIQHTMFSSFIKNYDFPEGIKTTHVMTIMNIKFLKSASMSTLSHRLNLEKGSFTTVANKLIKKGYITSTRSESDKRVYELSLTEKGKALAKDFGSKHRNYMAELMDELDEEKKEKFFEAMDIVTQTIVSFSHDEELENILLELTKCHNE